MKKKKDQRNILIGVLLIAIVIMSVGYAAFATTLTINGTSKITGNWDVAITGIEKDEKTATADGGTPTYTALTATFAAEMNEPGDSVEYTITIKNSGSIDAKLNEVVPTITGAAEALKYTIDAPAANSVLASGETATVKVTATYNADSTDNVTSETNTKALTLTLDYRQNNA